MNPIQTFPLLAGLALLAVPAVAQDKLALKCNAPVGTTAWFTSKSTTSQQVDMGVQQMEMGNAIEIVLGTKVLAANEDGSLSVETTFAVVRGRMELPMMGEVAFDSTSEEEGDDPMGIGNAMTALAGAKVTATVSAAGKITRLDGLDKVLADARKKAGGMMGGQMLAGTLNEGMIQRQIQAVFGNLPKEPTAVGGTWEVDDFTAEQKDSPVTSKVQLTLAKVDADSAEITMAGTLEKKAIKEGDAPPARGGMPDMKDIKIKNGVLKGSETISRKDGMVLRCSHEMSMDLSMPNPMGGGGDMSIQQVNKMEVERTTEDAARPKPKKTEGGDKGK